MHRQYKWQTLVLATVDVLWSRNAQLAKVPAQNYSADTVHACSDNMSLNQADDLFHLVQMTKLCIVLSLRPYNETEP